MDRLAALRENRALGAIDLALEALDIADEWIAAGRPAGELAAALERMHPAIAAIRNVAVELRLAKAGPASLISGLRQSLRDGNRLIAREVANLIPAHWVVITISNSSTVRDALIAVGSRGVYAMESHPGGEGTQMAAALRSGLRGSSGHEFVELIADDSTDRYVPAADCALVGIDSFDATGAIWHKIGTLPLARLCRRLGKPFFAVGHSLKRSVQALSEDPPADPETGVAFFDRTPGELITRLITEGG